MSRKPQTPNDDEGPGGNNTLETIPTGKRFTENEEILRLEKEMAAEGFELENRAIPARYQREYDPGEIEEIIALEVEKENSNRQLIGYLNEVKQ